VAGGRGGRDPPESRHLDAAAADEGDVRVRRETLRHCINNAFIDSVNGGAAVAAVAVVAVDMRGGLESFIFVIWKNARVPLHIKQNKSICKSAPSRGIDTSNNASDALSGCLDCHARGVWSV
jgi:hypothetical protein